MAALVLAVGACAPELEIDQSKLVDGPPNAAEAEAATCAAFGISDCPRMFFYADDPVNCPENVNTFPYDGECVGGAQGVNGILMVMPVGATKGSDTPVVHELAHWAWGDTWHKNLAVWGDEPNTAGGLRKPGSRVGDQYAALVAAGL